MSQATDDVSKLIDQLADLERAIERKLIERRKALHVRFDNGKVSFERHIIEHHKQLKTGLLKFLATSPFIFYATAPVIYMLIVPFVLLDVLVSFYQAVCFRAWKIARVQRADYIVLDRHLLAYLNVIEKLNCTYCAYANGVISYVREIASRTEQYWCPIKHAERVRGTHERYRDFLDFGDGEGFVKKSSLYRAKLQDVSGQGHVAPAQDH